LLVRWLSGPLVAFFLMSSPTVLTNYAAAEDVRKVSAAARSAASARASSSLSRGRVGGGV